MTVTSEFLRTAAKRLRAASDALRAGAVELATLEASNKPPTDSMLEALKGTAVELLGISVSLPGVDNWGIIASTLKHRPTDPADPEHVRIIFRVAELAASALQRGEAVVPTALPSLLAEELGLGPDDVEAWEMLLDIDLAEESFRERLRDYMEREVVDSAPAAPVEASEKPTAPASVEASEKPTALADPMLQFFAYEHLPPHLGAVSRPFGELAQRVATELPRNPERTAALRKILEGKDAAVRALLYREVQR
jgi:hypothetical protein